MKSTFPRAGLLIACLALVSISTVSANNPGGWTPLVTNAVTTGTEAFGSKTDRFLDNGILHVLVSTNGNVDSIKYLKPGSAGTPKANGMEMVSQFGSSNPNFGNHYYIYYYWYPDGSQDSVYSGTTTASNTIDLAYKRTYNPSIHQVAADVEIHYTLGQGNTALYVYLVANHPSSYSVYSNMNLSFIQMIWPVAHDATNFLCENMYIDKVKTGLSRNGQQQTREALEPTYNDAQAATNVPGLPTEINRITTGVFSNQLDGKYSYNVDYAKLGAWGRGSDTNKVGQWVVMGSHEYISNGPTVRDYVNGWGLMYMMPVGGHYDDTGISVSSNANWTKVFGPWALYFNSPTNGLAGWQDAQNQALAEQQAWPYSWLTNSAIYQPTSQRATVTGKLIIHDALRPGASAAGAWVGLAAPDSGAENATNNWQFQSDGYQYWVRAAADGTFTIPAVQTFSPYGGPAAYQLYAYSDGTNSVTGEIGEFSTAPFTFASGSTTNLGTLTWQVPHPGGTLVWEIGIPDRSAAEFRHGDEFAKPALWWGFSNDFANPLEYNVANNNWSNALNYCHSVDNMATSPWKWHLNFNLPSVRPGTYWLNIAYATAASHQIIRVNNDSTLVTNFVPDNAHTGASTYYRQGIHAKYSVAHIAIPSSSLLAGSNTITLDHEVHSDHTYAHFMYDYLNLETPAVTAPGAPTGLTAIAGNAQVALSWNASPGATGYNVKDANVSGGPYTTIASNVAATSYIDSNIVNGTTCYYVVSAVNAAGESPNSSEVSAHVLSLLEQWQMNYFGCTNCPQAAASADPDGDGQNNQAEFLAGTDPTSSLSGLRILSLLTQSNDVDVTWATAGGRTNAVQVAAGETSGGYTTDFTDLSGPVIIPGVGDATTNYVESGGATSSPSRYYRVRVIP